MPERSWMICRAAGRALRRVVHAQQVEQGQVGGVDRGVLGGQERGDHQGERGGRDAEGRPAQPAGEDLGERGAPAAHTGGRTVRVGPADRFEDHRAPAGRGGDGALVGQELRGLVAAAVRTLRARRVVGGGGEQSEGAQAGVGRLAGAGRGTFGGAQEQPLGLNDLAAAGEGGGGEGRGGGVGIRQDGGGGVQ